MRASVVIGAMFGDEGKGLFTDYLCSLHDPNETLVIRFNGGGQAGHTVVCPDGRRHVFSHVGCGTFQNIPTYLSEHFVVCPEILRIELEELRSNFSILPKIYIHPDAKVTLPFDKLLNRKKHKANNHGTCGEGVHETMVRHEKFKLTVEDLKQRSSHELFKYILLMWASCYANDLGITDDEFKTTLTHWIEVDVNYFRNHTMMHPLEKIVYMRNYIFEGAQGLGLDQDHEYFPHVTHSKTGLDNVIDILNTAKHITGIDAHYISRTYATRHGNGPFPTEVEDMRREDDTNIFSKWQGRFRLGNLDLNLLKKHILDDLSRPCGHMFINPSLVLTHADQQKQVLYRMGDSDHSIPVGLLPPIIERFTGIKTEFICSGPTRETVQRLSHDNKEIANRVQKG